ANKLLRNRGFCRRLLCVVLALGASVAGADSSAGHLAKGRSVSPLVSVARDRGPAALNERHRVVVALDLRNREQLEAFLIAVQDPSSRRYRQFLTPSQFAELYAPAATDEASVVAHLVKSGLKITDRFPNRLLVGAEGTVAAIVRAFGVRIHHVDYAGRPHYAVLSGPSLPSALASAVVGVIGLDDLTELRPHIARITPAAALGMSCCAFAPPDLTRFYDDTPDFDGSGQTIVVAGAFAWKDTDVSTFN